MWALGYPGRSAWLLVLWVGITALMRGVTEIVLAFKLRGVRAALGVGHQSLMNRPRSARTIHDQVPHHRRRRRRSLPSSCCPGAARSTPPSATARSSAKRSATCVSRTPAEEAQALDGRHQRAARRPRQQVRVLHRRGSRRHPEQPRRPRRAHDPGPENLAQQDLAVLERSAKNIAEDANETSQAAWDGVLEGLSDCTQG